MAEAIKSTSTSPTSFSSSSSSPTPTPLPKINYLERMVGPHKQISREVEESDLEKVIEEAHILYSLCFYQHDFRLGGEAVAHSQIDKDNPLRFFVTKDKRIIINPIITRHTKVFVKSFEGCLDFPQRSGIDVARHRKIEVSYKTLKDVDGKIAMVEENDSLEGHWAFVFQHEIDHINGINIYNE
jgi:peptide deformylase